MPPRALQVVDDFLRQEQALGTAHHDSLAPLDWPLLLVAASGGADSMALLDCLDQLRTRRQFRLEAIHVHHGLRGPDADQDAAFVQQLCAARGLGCHIVRQDTRALMAREDLSLEEAARAVRYEAFATVAEATGARAVVIAHHLDDDVETLLMRLVTGASLTSLAGMEPISRRGELFVWRPFLRTPQALLYTHLQERQLTYRHDASNLEMGLLRNRIRLELLPRIRSDYNPQVVRTLGKLLDELKVLRTSEIPQRPLSLPEELALNRRETVEEFEDETEILQSLQAREPEKWQFPVTALQGLDPRERWGLWKGVLRGLGIPVKRLNRTLFEDLDMLISRTHGTLAIALPKGLEARRTYGTLVFGPSQTDPPLTEEVSLQVGSWEWTDQYSGWVILMERLDARQPQTSPGAVHPGTRWWEGALFQTVLSLSNEERSLLVRSRLAGDQLGLAGGGHRSLKEWFIDTKLPQLFRDRWPVVADAAGTPLWVPGLPVPVTPGTPAGVTVQLTAIKTAHWGG